MPLHPMGTSQVELHRKIGYIDKSEKNLPLDTELHIEFDYIEARMTNSSLREKFLHRSPDPLKYIRCLEIMNGQLTSESRHAVDEESSSKAWWEDLISPIILIIDQSIGQILSVQPLLLPAPSFELSSPSLPFLYQSSLLPFSARNLTLLGISPQQ